MPVDVKAATDRLMRFLAVEGVTGQEAAIGRELAAALDEASTLDSVREVRALGAVGVVALDRPVDVPAVTRAALEHGAWVRPFRNLVYTMPPYVADPGDVATIASAVTAAIAAVHG
jgi:adenosylmethionine-8-amino-7-oxononanoate aminotransferase